MNSEPEEKKKLGIEKLKKWLNKTFQVKMTDGRILVGSFLCTDRDANLILGSCTEYLSPESQPDEESLNDEPRMLGLVMIPGRHIVSIELDVDDVYSLMSLRQFGFENEEVM